MIEAWVHDQEVGREMELHDSTKQIIIRLWDWKRSHLLLAYGMVNSWKKKTKNKSELCQHNPGQRDGSWRGNFSHRVPGAAQDTGTSKINEKGSLFSEALENNTEIKKKSRKQEKN